MPEVIINTTLAGVRRFLASARAEATALAELGLATKGLGYEMATTTKRSWLMNQSLFTARRLVYGVTLGFIASGVAAVKWGNDYNQAIQGARVALSPFFDDATALQRSLDRLWTIAKYSPFQIQDMTLAFARMAPSMQQLGMTGDDVTRILKNLTDALSVGMAGRVTPAALNRASVALQHLAFLGRLTGMSVLQLARDGIPIYAALSKELGLTADQMHNIGKLGIPASVALEAINRYIESTPGYANAARRLANQSVAGLFSQLKDNISRTMGLAERGWFTTFQGFLVSANSFFTRLQNEQTKTNNLFIALDRTITPRTHTFIRIWNLLVATFHDAWTIFSTLVKTVATSKPLWAAIVLTLYSLHIILAGIAHSTAVWVPLLKVLIPLLILYWTWTKAITLYETLYWQAVRLSILWQFRKARGLKILIGIQKLYTVATVGSIRAENGQFIALSRLQKVVLRLRYAFIGLSASMLANPIGIIIAAVVLLAVGLVILYFKWKRFHDLVNETATFLYNHAYILALIPIIGPFVAAVVLMIKYWKTLVHWIRTAVSWIRKVHVPHIGIPHGGGGIPFIPGIQHGGTISHGGLAMVGERGPEVLSLPRGATVTPLRPAFNFGDRSQNERPIKVELRVDGRKMAEVVARHQTNVNARR